MDFDLRVIALPMVTKFRGLQVRELALLHGPMGWGEFSVFDDYTSNEAAWWLLSAIEAAYLGWPTPVRTSVPVNATIPAVSPDEVADVLARYSGCTTAKVKVAEGDDLNRVRAVLDHLGPQGKIRVDANGAWSVGQAEEMLHKIYSLAGQQLEYAEQPCATVEELAELRRRFDGVIKVAADESIRRGTDPYRVKELDAADVIVLKVAPLGGVRQCLALLAEIGLPAVVSSELGSSVGLRAGVALAAAVPELPFACGLATSELFISDVSTHPIRPIHGAINLHDVNPDRMEEFLAPRERQEWWRERAVAAWYAGTAELVQKRGWRL